MILIIIDFMINLMLQLIIDDQFMLQKDSIHFEESKI